VKSLCLKSKEVSWLWIGWFCACLIPYSIGEGLSANYLFALTPLALFVLRGKLQRPPDLMWALIGLFIFIFVISAAYQWQFIEYGLRRVSSFVLFMSMFAFCFGNITQKMVNSFLVAIVLVSMYFSGYTLIRYFTLGGEALGWSAKYLVGTQRIGFIYLFSLWILVFWLRGKVMLAQSSVQEKFDSIRASIRKKKNTQKRKSGKTVIGSLAIGLIIVGLFLTFSRSSIVSLFFSVLCYLFFTSGLRVKKVPKIVILYSAFFIIAFEILLYLFPSVIDFFNHRLLLFSTEGDIIANLNEPETSEGTRMVIWRDIFDFVLRNPLTGSGFLGVWVLYGDSGSAHNQFLDAFFRLGLVGACGYFYLYFKLMVFTFRFHKGLFFGLTSATIYGLFHETFKESQGAFVFAFLIGMYASYLRSSMYLKDAVRKQRAETLLSIIKPKLSEEGI